jgi:UDP-N-acetylmuramoyl-tripeptide--D-alanyl-D-alanine ligase
MAALAGKVAWKLNDLWKSVKWRTADEGLRLGARLHRKRLKDVTFIGITGTAGKTTTKDLSAAILAKLGACQSNFVSENTNAAVERVVLSTKPAHRYCVVEASATKPGYLARSLQALQPRICAVTVIGREHYSAYRSLEAIAEEKGRIVRALPSKGTAVLNIDDPLVREMGRGHPGRILWVGKDEKATLRLLESHSVWPTPLVLRVSYEGQTKEVVTRLHGTHLVVPVLSALGIALAAGATLDQAVGALAEVDPPEGRMQVVTGDDGVTFIRDDWKAPQWSLQAPLDFLGRAQAKRKVVVIGTISDSAKTPARRYSNAARDALKVADLVVVVGVHAHGLDKVRIPDPGKSLKAFANLHDAAAFLGTELRSGDLVLLKGSNPQDHLVRLLLSRERAVACWQSSCGKTRFCGRCPELYAVPTASSRTVVASTLAIRPTHGALEHHAAPLIVGLGNPGTEYSGTPHNAGHETVEGLAAKHAGTWEAQPEGLVCTLDINGILLTLFKPGAKINRSGALVAAFLARTGRTADDCVVVHDDTDLALGSCREKAQGGDGGHKGIQSIIAALGTDKFSRVRVGVRRKGDERSAKELVLARFSGPDQGEFLRGLDASRSAALRIANQSQATREELAA